MLEYQKKAGEMRITIVWTLPPAPARYRQSITRWDVQVETRASESGDAQSKFEHTTVLQHQSSGDPDTESEDSVGDE